MATSVVILTSLGHVDGPRNLDGRTHDGTVGLVPHTGAPFSATRWRRRTNGDVWTVECLGKLPGDRFPDGRTHDGSVGLAPNTPTRPSPERSGRSASRSPSRRGSRPTIERRARARPGRDQVASPVADRPRTALRTVATT
jgi:hypothetical protein